MSDKNKEDKNPGRSKEDGPIPLMALTAIAFEFLGYLFMPAALGYGLDVFVFTEDGTSPSWFFIGGMASGFLLSLYYLFRQAKEIASRGMEDRSVSKKKKSLSISQRADVVNRDMEELGRKIDKFLEKHKGSQK